MRKNLGFGLAPIAFVVLAGAAQAAAPTQAPPAGNDRLSFDTLDRNNDGKISLSEASDNDALFVAFKNLDKNKDGELSKEEFAAFQQARNGA
jgi:EF hand